ncbi:hypothetical protein [Labilibaculum sp.]|uniref:hypothetical protein n=1 Tax=Labilibaculum sp. TaxID=2060723 RepID=UPI0035654B20
MKNLLKSLLVMCFTIGLFSSSYAQAPTADNTQTGVVAGGTYTYTIPTTTGETPAWTVLDDSGAELVSGAGDFDLSSVSDFEKSITWNTQGTFYVKVITTDDATLCTNQYVIQVDVATNDYVVAFNTTATVSVYCADDANIASGMEITLDVTLGGTTPDATYYDMEVQYQIDSGSTELATIVSGSNAFNIPAITIADAVNPGFTSVTVTILKVTDSKGVEFTPASGDENFVITVNPIPAIPTITF